MDITIDKQINGDIKYQKLGKRDKQTRLTLTVKKSTLDDARKSAFRQNMKKLPDDWIVMCISDKALPCNLFIGVDIEKEHLRIPSLKANEWTPEKGAKVRKLVKYFDFYCTRNEYMMVQSVFLEAQNCQTALKHKVDIVRDSFLGKAQDLMLNLTALTPKSDSNSQMSEMVESILRKALDIQEIFIMLSSITRHNEQVLTHSMATSLLAAHLGHLFGQSRPMQEKLVTCSLLHNIGLYYVAPDIVLKYWSGGILSREERMEYQAHTRNGQDICYRLKKLGVKIPDELEYVCYQHHEDYNGTGYPNHIEDAGGNPKVHLWSYKVKICSDFAFQLITDDGNLENAIRQVRRNKDKHHPKVYGLFTQLIDDLKLKTLAA